MGRNDIKTQYFKPLWSVCNHGTEKNLLYGGGRRAAHPQPQAGRTAAPPTAGRRAAHPKPQAGRREASPTAGHHRYLRLQESAVLQTVIDECSSPRTEVRGYRKYRLSGELCLSGECRSPYTGYLGGSVKRLLFVKRFCNSPFFTLFIFMIIQLD